jgi:hypothetical protein
VEGETGRGEPNGRKLETRWHETYMPPCSNSFTSPTVVGGLLSMGSITLLWPGYFADMQNELCKTTNFIQHFPVCEI